MPRAPFIEIKGVSKTFGKNIVLNNLNLSIPYGEIFGILGKSGSGKTTLLNILIGFIHPDKGNITFQSRDINYDLFEVRKQFGFAAQEGSFYPTLTVEETLTYFGKMYNKNSDYIKKRISKLLSLVELGKKENVVAGNLSAGMQKRLDIACSLIHDPKIVVLDEPTQDLDPALRREILDLLKKINKEEETTIILTTHLLGEVEVICDRVAILHENTIIKQGTVDELEDIFSGTKEIHIVTSPGNYKSIVEYIRGDKDIEGIRKVGNKLIVYAQDAEKVMKALLTVIDKEDEELIEIGLHKPPLDEVFEYLTK